MLRYSVQEYTTTSDNELRRTCQSSKYIAVNVHIKAREENSESDDPPYWIWRRAVTVFVEVPVSNDVSDFRDVELLTIHGRGVWDTMLQLVGKLPFYLVGDPWTTARNATDWMEVGIPFAGPGRSTLVFRQRPDALAGVSITSIPDIDHVIGCTRRFAHQLGDWTDVVGIMDVSVSLLGACDPQNPNGNFWAVDARNMNYPFNKSTGLTMIRPDADPFPKHVWVLFVPATYGQRMFDCSRVKTPKV